MTGRWCRLEPLDPRRHARPLFDANRLDDAGDNWTYLTPGPFDDFDAYRRWIEQAAASEDPLFHAIVDSASGEPTGVAALMRVDPANGVIEIGHLNFSPRLQRTRAATEAIHLLLGRAFDELGYRRVEWKCDSLNAASRRAAGRFGFTFEGIFRQAMVYKGRNRDTAWYSILDREWPPLRAGFEAWLAPENFDPEGRQRRRLSECR